MSPNGGGEPKGKLHDLIVKTWGSFDSFKAKFTEEAANHFGSGWAWLVRDAHNHVRSLRAHMPSAELEPHHFYCSFAPFSRNVPNGPTSPHHNDTHHA